MFGFKRKKESLSDIFWYSFVDSFREEILEQAATKEAEMRGGPIDRSKYLSSSTEEQNKVIERYLNNLISAQKETV